MSGGDPERALSLTYAPRDARGACAAIWALDDALAQVVRTTREPMVGQMRLTWWHDALTRLDSAPPPPEPVLRALADAPLARGVTGAMLARIVEGWEELIEPGAISDEALGRYTRRGGALFAALGVALGADGLDPVGSAGEGWALVDLAWNVRDPAAATRARALAEAPLRAATAARWSRRGRSLGVLAHFARADLARDPERGRGQGSPGRVLRALHHWLTGR